MEYSDEPRLVFSPLSERDYCDFYSLEMDDFTDDVCFYSSRLKKNDIVLELGCGSGRLSRRIAPYCREVHGVDISAEMLHKAAQFPHTGITYHHMDMTKISFPSPFDVIIIPYNTLNLLGDSTAVEHCLHLCRQHLRRGGILLLHLYHPDDRLMQSGGKKSFQFAILNTPNGDVIVKETLKSYHLETQTLRLEERYRVRPHSFSSEPKRDLSHTLLLYAPQLRQWQKSLENAGFSLTASPDSTAASCYGSFTGTTFTATETTLLLINATAV
ncbi:MAG: methyltransferase domain-containing protein [Desulfopila sp.]|jgi:cyclopropane fatty-acyl-phospholipid synthase-like methyltransferase|nr:methyltransferase domain-containing protein [Desulfopila sp.]